MPGGASRWSTSAACSAAACDSTAGAGLGEEGQLLRLLVLPSTGPERAGDVLGRQVEQLQVAGAEGRPRGGLADPQLTEHLSVGHQGDRPGRAWRRCRALRCDERPVGRRHGGAGHPESPHEAGERGVNAGRGRSGREGRLAEGAEQPIACDRSRAAAHDQATQAAADRPVEGGRDDEPQGGEERQVETDIRPARGLDGDEHADEGDDEEAAGERRPERPRRDGRAEEDACREDRIGCAHDGERDEGGPDPSVCVADHGQEPQACPDRGGSDRRQRRPELSLPQRRRVRRAHGRQEPPGTEREGGEAGHDPGPAEDLAGNRAERRVRRRDGDGRPGIDDARERERDQDHVAQRGDGELSSGGVPVGRDHQGEVGDSRQAQRGRQLLDGSRLGHRVRGCRQALQDDAAAPGRELEREQREHACGRRARACPDGQAQPHAQDRRQGLRNDLELIRDAHPAPPGRTVTPTCTIGRHATRRNGAIPEVRFRGRPRGDGDRRP